MTFTDDFMMLSGFAPLLWQQRLYEDHFLRGDLPSACDIPTGLGKTSVIAIWVLALAAQSAAGRISLPRRLVYVVNRRTVVDQATDDAIAIRKALRDDAGRHLSDALASLCVDKRGDGSPLAISTLRGELADNRQWQAEPARPAIIVGTVDMIGSRLLFGAYGAGWKMRAFNAGLIGHDSLVVHDESHLAPAFGALLAEVNRVQVGSREPRPMRALELSATQRVSGVESVFALRDDEKEESIVRRRTRAPKELSIVAAADSAEVAAKLVDAAMAHDGACARIIVYVKSPKVAGVVRTDLVKRVGADRVRLLTGTIRGYERDALATSEFFDSFRARPSRPPLDRTRYLVSTSAGEVGVNLDADHLACDLATLDSMVQRLGRVNRLGREDPSFAARVDVIAADDDETPEVVATRSALERLLPTERGRNASPQALREILDADTIRAAFARAPRILKCTDILLDAWALTSVRGEFPGRHPVAPWLHGVETDIPTVTIAWRRETLLLANLVDRGKSRDAAEWLQVHPILARERLQERVDRAADALARLGDRLNKARLDTRVVLVDTDGEVSVGQLGDLERDAIADCTVLIPCDDGGLDDGFLSAQAERPAVDVADATSETTRQRILVRRDDESQWVGVVLGTLAETRADSLERCIEMVRSGLVEKTRLVCGRDSDDRTPTTLLLSFGERRRPETALDASSATAKTQTLTNHLDWAGRAAALITRKLHVDETIASAIVEAARWHDKGKNRDGWQRAVGNPPPREALAKTAHGRFEFDKCPGYRHELGSLIEAERDEELRQHPERDLLLHLIASHHARARPHFEEREWDVDASDEENQRVVHETTRRFARLQRRFGRWGLAWLEAVLKSADVIATLRGETVAELES